MTPINLMSIQWECYCCRQQLFDLWQIAMTPNVLQWIPKFSKTNSSSSSPNIPKSLANSSAKSYPTERPIDQISLHLLKDSVITNVKISSKEQQAHSNLFMQEYLLLSKGFRNYHRFRRLNHFQRMSNHLWGKKMCPLSASNRWNPKAWPRRRFFISTARILRKLISKAS